MKKKSMFSSIFLIMALIFSNFMIVAGEETDLANDSRVQPESELTYYIDVTYDGKDESGATIEAGDENSSRIASKDIKVADKIPDGMEFVGIVPVNGESIGAATNCSGKVVKDSENIGGKTGEENKYDATSSEFVYRGVHYTASDRTVRFTVNNLQVGGKITVGVIVKTPSVEAGQRKDFYNYANGKESNLNKNSNNTHVYIEGENATNVTLNKVTYEYEGTIPNDAEALLPSEASNAAGVSVGVAAPIVLDGYTFSGWSVKSGGATISDGSFTMPANDVALKGRFTQNTAYTVKYQIVGDKPSGYTKPADSSYPEGQTVTVDSLTAGTKINGYVFSGWEVDSPTSLVINDNKETVDENEIVTSRDFIMPSNNVVIKGSFNKVPYTVSYEFYESDSFKPTEEEINSILSHANLQPITHYESDIVPVASKPIAAGTIIEDSQGKHKFLGWDRENNFTMPAENVAIRGEWMLVPGVFEPQISKEIVDKKDFYEVGDTVEYKITVTNPHDFAINNVIISENNGKASFVAGDGYELVGDHLAEISSIPANSSVVLYANYVVDENDAGTIENEVEFVSGTGENGYALTDGEYKATSEFMVRGNEPEPEPETEPKPEPKPDEKAPESRKDDNEGNTSSITNEEKDSNSTKSGAKEVSDSCHKTGDESNIYVYVIISLISLICFVTISTLNNPQKRNNKIH